MNNKIDKNIVIGQFISNKIDKQRTNNKVGEELLQDLVKDLYQSTHNLKIPLYILTNEVETFDLPYIHVYKQFIHEKYNTLGIYFIRWIMTYEYISAHPEIEKVVLMDINDTEILQDPFNLIEENKIYVGDELFDLSTYIISSDSTLDYVHDFLVDNSSLQLLNPGLIAGSRAIILEFLEIYMFMIDRSFYNGNISQFGNFEMNIFNYIMYNYFDDRIKHGRKISSKFLHFEEKSGSWFKHK